MFIEKRSVDSGIDRYVFDFSQDMMDGQVKTRQMVVGQPRQVVFYREAIERVDSDLCDTRKGKLRIDGAKYIDHP
jgi:hypothetical protein